MLHDFYIPALSASRRYDRVAGYFRSTSLAVASQGFSAMIRRGGHIRLVVGADLDPDDVRAIVDRDDRKRLADELIRQLGEPADWPEAVENGLGLLSWMVERRLLEIRVALRRHRVTREPLPFASREDGYVHEKWAIFEDGQGNRLLAEGSLNESRTALVLNAENLSVHCDWEGDKEAQRVAQARQEFEAIWANIDPGLYVLPLPEAVRQHLITIARPVAHPKEVDGSSEAPPAAAEPTPIEWLRFAVLRDAPKMPNGRYVGMTTAPVEPWPHQAIVARRLIETWPYSFLLCDEVGLGKTIEAGLALRSLILSGIARRVLIAPPASLTRQWQNELQQKFLLRFARALSGAQPQHDYIHPVTEQLASKSVFAPDQVIVSTGLMRRKERLKELAAVEWDIVLVDEAHYARRSNATAGAVVQPRYGDLYRTLKDTLRPRTRSLWMATATPMQLDPIEVYDLLRLTRRVGPFQEEPSLTQRYYDIQGHILRGERVSDDDLAFLRQMLRSVRRHDPPLAAFIRQTVLTSANRSQYDLWLDQSITPTTASLKQLMRAIFASAPLSRVMMRHSRALLRIYQAEGKLNANLARRHILPMRRITYTIQEREAYDALQSYCTELARQVAASNDQEMRVSTGFYLSFLQRRFASSLHAIGETLKRRRERVRATLEFVLGGKPPSGVPALDESATAVDDLEQDDTDAEVIEQLLKNRSERDLRWELDKLETMLAGSLYDISTVSSKMLALLGYVESRKDPTRPGRIRQMVIFTQFWDTLDDIVRRFRQVDPALSIGTYSGRGGQYARPDTSALAGTERDEIKQRFLRGQIDILVCTDAAAEGLNLQTADYLVNFDLPWNPAKVEQRIGRIDRIGQRYADVYVQNLCYLGSVEEIVYDRLLNRLRDMMAVVGEQQFSMLPVTEEDFRRLAEGVTTEEQLEREAKARMEISRRRSQETELTGQEVYEIYQRMARDHAATRLPISLDGIWRVLAQSAYLQAIGCRVERDLAGEGTEVLILSGIPGVPDGTALTVARSLFERGVESLGSGLRFATYGEPSFESLLELTKTWSCPSCVRRISLEPPPGWSNEYVAYIAAVKTAEGSSLRLITAIDVLADLQLDHTREVTDEDATPFLTELKSQAETEFKLNGHVRTIETDNERSGRAQAALSLGTAYGFITGRQRVHNADENFWRELNAARTQLAERTAAGGAFRVMYIPECLGKIVGTAFLPFEVRPKISDQTYWIERASTALLAPALDAAARVADGMRAKKSELSTDAVLARVRAEMEQVVSRE